LLRITDDYGAALRQRLNDLSVEDRERIAAWCDWAEQWAERTDPVANVSRIRGLDDERDQLLYRR
jgi:hypothetical protein